MPFQVLETALDLAAVLRDPLARLQHRDRDLASQARRACNSVALNLDEGRRRAGQDRLHHFRIALGSAAELDTALRLALAWGYLDPASLAGPRGLCDRVIAMAWRLVHGPRR